MKCRNNHEFTTPLVLFNGEYACPECGDDLKLSANEGLIETDENKELFKQSEIIYFTAIKKCTETKQFNRMIKKAFELCRDSALQMNPFAIVKMGFYYDKDYVETTSLSENQRCKVAMDYYNLIIEYGQEFSDARNMAMVYAYEMLSQQKASERSKYQDVFQRLAKEIGSIVSYINASSAENEYIQEEKTSAQKLNDTFNCLELKDRKPIFGFFRMNKEELESLNLTKIKNQATVWVINLVDGKINLNKKSSYSSVENYEESNDYLVLFYNSKNNKIKANLGSKQRKLMKKAYKQLYKIFDSPRESHTGDEILVSELSDFFNKIISYGSSLVFYDDDVIKNVVEYNLFDFDELAKYVNK